MDFSEPPVEDGADSDILFFCLFFVFFSLSRSFSSLFFPFFCLSFRISALLCFFLWLLLLLSLSVLLSCFSSLSCLVWAETHRDRDGNLDRQTEISNAAGQKLGS